MKAKARSRCRATLRTNQPITAALAPPLAAATPVGVAPPTSTQAAGNNSAAGAQHAGNDGYSISSSSAVAAVIVLASIALRVKLDMPVFPVGEFSCTQYLVTAKWIVVC